MKRQTLRLPRKRLRARAKTSTSRRRANLPENSTARPIRAPSPKCTDAISRRKTDNRFVKFGAFRECASWRQHLHEPSELHEPYEPYEPPLESAGNVLSCPRAAQ